MQCLRRQGLSSSGSKSFPGQLRSLSRPLPAVYRGLLPILRTFKDNL